MDIYILRDGKEIGPFAELTIHTLLKQGDVLTTDLAWRPGMPKWAPLHGVLYPAPEAVHAAKPPPPPPEASTSVPVPAPVIALTPAAPPEPAHARQRAFLDYMGIVYTPNVSKEEAAVLASDAMDSPKDPARLASWNADRLKLHPELFAAEIQTLKANRPAHYLELTQKLGSHFFPKLTQVHSQVLVSWLDSRFPNWDSKPEEAASHYFLPAINAKFPQLGTSLARSKYKFPKSRKLATKVASKTLGSSAGAHAHLVRVREATSPATAAVRGVIMGLVLLATFYVLYAGYQMSQRTADEARVQSGMAPVAPQQTRAAQSPERSGKRPSNRDKTSDATPPASQAAPERQDPAPPAGEPKMIAAGSEPAAPIQAADPGAAQPAPVPNPTADAPETKTELVAAPAPQPVAGPADPPQPQTRTSVVITKVTEVQLQFGRALLQPGIRLKINGQEGQRLKVRYGPNDVYVPVSSTDFADPLPAAAPAPVPAPAPAAAVGTPAPAGTTPPAAPATPASSLF